MPVSLSPLFARRKCHLHLTYCDVAVWFDLFCDLSLLFTSCCRVVFASFRWERSASRATSTSQRCPRLRGRRKSGTCDTRMYSASHLLSRSCGSVQPTSRHAASQRPAGECSSSIKGWCTKWRTAKAIAARRHSRINLFIKLRKEKAPTIQIFVPGRPLSANWSVARQPIGPSRNWFLAWISGGSLRTCPKCRLQKAEERPKKVS